MRGILSAAPGPAGIRLLTGAYLLLLIQAGLVLWSGRVLDPALRVLVGLIFTFAAGALVGAIHGLSDQRRNTSRRCRHGS